MKKILYLINDASTKIRIMAIIAFVLVIASIATLVISTNKVINGPVEEISSYKIISKTEFEETNQIIKEDINNLKETLKNADDETVKYYEELFGMSANEIVELLDVVSIHSLGEYLRLYEESIEVAWVFEIIEYIIRGSSWILIAFLILSLLCMSLALAIVIVVISFPFFMMFAGFKSFIIFAVLCITYGILFRMVKLSYRDYKNEEKRQIKEAVRAAKEAAQSAKEAAQAAEKASKAAQEALRMVADKVDDIATEVEE